MSEVFISYTHADEEIARFIHNHLKAEGVSAFLAAATLRPGEKWTEAVFRELKQAKWVLLLASRKACESPYVQQEVGAAIGGDKRLVPIIWDIEPNQLPGWVSQHHVLNMRDRSMLDLQAEVGTIAAEIKQSRGSGLLIAGLLFAAIAASSK